MSTIVVRYRPKADQADENPLAATEAFADFQAGIGERCAEGEGPNPQPARLVGSYRLVANG